VIGKFYDRMYESKSNLRRARDAAETRKAKPITKKVIKTEIKRIDYLREKYGKLSSTELNERINTRGINEEAICFGSKKTWGEFLGEFMEKGKTTEQIKNSYITLIRRQSPWSEGYNPNNNIRVLKEGDTFNMVLTRGQDIDMSGGFGILNDVPSTSFARNNMGIKSNWKVDCEKTVIYKIKPGMELHCPSGPIGPQIDLDIDRYLPGDMSLTQLDLFKGLGKIERLDYIEPIEDSVKFIK